MPALRSRMLPLAVGLTIALGVAALTAAFGIVNAALFRQPPFEDAGRIALLYLLRDDHGTPRRERWSFARIRQLEQSQKSFEQVANYSLATLTLSGETDTPETVRGEMVASSYFRMLRVAAVQGRLLGGSEDSVANPVPVVVVGRALARRLWPGDVTRVGRLLRINGVTLTVIGVLPEAFRGLSGQAELWLPAAMAPKLSYAEYVSTNQNFISVAGRLRPGVSLRAAQSELAVLGAAVNRAVPSDPARPEERVSATAAALNEVRTDATVRRSLTAGALQLGVELPAELPMEELLDPDAAHGAERHREAEQPERHPAGEDIVEDPREREADREAKQRTDGQGTRPAGDIQRRVDQRPGQA